MLPRWLAVGLGCGASLALAQAPPPQSGGFVSSVAVRVVNVEVAVSNPSGDKVADLGPGDFELREDGRPQKITNFFRILDGTARLDDNQASAGVRPDDERFRRRVLLVVDNNFLDPATRRKALEQVRDFVATNFSGDAEWGVAAIGERLQYLMPFTRERFQVAAALDELDRLATYSERHAADYTITQDPIRQRIQEQQEARGATGMDIGADYRFVSREHAMRNLRSFATTAHVLGGLMRSYSAFGGRKAIVIVSGKMEFHPELGFLQSRDVRTQQDIGLTTRVQSDPGIEAARQELEAVLQGLVQAANASGFQLYTVTATGLTNPMRGHDVSNRQLGTAQSSRNIGSFAAPPDLSDADTAPRTLSDGTGGLSLRSNKIKDDLARVAADTGSYYSLAYSPDHEPDHKYHRIAVDVKRKGLKVRCREGYLDLTAGEKLAEELATSLAFPKPKGTFPLELSVVEAGDETGKPRLRAHVSMPAKLLTLLPAGAGGAMRGEAEVYLAIYNELGDNLSVTPQRFPINIPAGQDPARIGTFGATLNFTLPPGAYTVSVTVRDPIVGEHGTAIRRVLVGKPKSETQNPSTAR